MICKKCKKVIADNFLRCPYCNTQVENSVEEKKINDQPREDFEKEFRGDNEKVLNQEKSESQERQQAQAAGSCPECGNVLFEGARNCSLCGWQTPLGVKIERSN